MSKDDRDILEVLKFELSFLEQGGYGRSVRTPWKPTSLFQDSLTCLNFCDPDRTHPCDECLLWDFVPPERRAESVPCHHIPLNQAGETVETIDRGDNQQDVEEAVGNWLRATIRRLEEERRGRMLQSKRKTVLIVDDDKRVLIALEAWLEDSGYDTTTAWSGHQALEALRPRAFDIVLVDEYLPDLDSGEILKRLQDLRTPAIVLRSRIRTAEAGAGVSSPACDFVDKWAPLAVVAAVQNRLSPAEPSRAA